MSRDDRWDPAVAAGICLLIYTAWRPGVYNFDGYSYLFQGLQPLENLNAHHLLWLPVQACFHRIASAFGLGPFSVAQGTGIAVSCATLFFVHKLLTLFSSDRMLSAAMVFFLALSPSYWFLALQNEPYPPLFLCAVLAVWGFLRYVETARLTPLVGALTSLSFAVYFQQAALLLFAPMLVVAVIEERRRANPRWLPLLFAFVAAGALIALPYLILAKLTGVDTVSEFKDWLVDYLYSQHGLQIRSVGLIKGAIGISRCLVPTVGLEEYLLHILRPHFILAFYAVVGCGGVVLIWFARRRLQAPPVRGSVRLLLLGMMGVWSAFVLAWEPGTAYYWVLTVILGMLIIALARSLWTLRQRTVVSILLVACGSWNGWANVRQDRLEASRRPDPWIARIEQLTRPADEVLVLDRDRIGYLDYDLLLYALERTAPGRAQALLTDYVGDRTHPSWQQRLADDINLVRQRGGTFWVSGQVLNPENYEDLTGENDPFTPYPLELFRGVDGAQVYRDVTTLLNSAGLRLSPLWIGNDRFFEIPPH